MRPSSRASAALVLWLAFGVEAFGQRSPGTHLRLPRLFADGMVVQRGSPIPIWGWAPIHANVVATFRGRSVQTHADSTGRWTASFAGSSAGGPYIMEVRAAGETVAIHDVLVGDVWVASGQSNMEFPLALTKDAAAEIAAAHDSLLRQFKVPTSWSTSPEDDLA